MDILIGDFCVTGNAKPNTVIKFTVKDASGASKGRAATMSESDGFWSGCVDFFADGFTSGDRLKVLDYDTHQTLNYTIPRMTLSADRSTDVASGLAPAGMHMELEAADFNTPLFGKDPYDVVEDVTANGSGAWSHDFGADNIDLMTGAGLELRATGAGGAVTVRRDFNCPRPVRPARIGRVRRLHAALLPDRRHAQDGWLHRWLPVTPWATRAANTTADLLMATANLIG